MDNQKRFMACGGRKQVHQSWFINLYKSSTKGDTELDRIY